MTYIKIIGTSHISRDSVKEILLFIKNQQPDIIAVELDAKRLVALFSEQRKLSFRDIAKIGLFGFIFRSLGSYVQKKLGEKFGLAPGSDIKSAILAAKKVNSKIYLIDQDIELTLQNLSNKMGAWERIKFVFYLFGGFAFSGMSKKLKNIDLRKVPPENIIEELTMEIKDKFPGIYEALISDRDRYMSNSILKIAKNHPESKILVVVGAGHKKGILKILKKHIRKTKN